MTSDITQAVDPFMLRDRPIGEVLDRVAASGFEAIELSHRDDVLPLFVEPTATETSIAELRGGLAASGVSIASVWVVYDWSNPDEAVRRRAVDWWRRAIEVTAELGVHRMNTEFAGDPQQPVESERSWRRSIEELVPMLEGAGITLSIEPHPYDFIEDGVRATDLVRGLGTERVRYLYCAPHSFSLGGEVADLVDAGSGITGHVHVADTYRPHTIIVNPPGRRPDVRVHQHLDIGAGEVPFELIFERLAVQRFAGVVTVSVFFFDERADESFRHNKARLDALLRGARLIE
jgi:myo-inositol catabolism protein IolH